MRVSVAIPAYNCSASISQTLDSVLGQTYQVCEVLVMNDGSTDDTASVLKSYGPRVTVLTQKNAGASVARNALSARATGDIVAFLDADDVWHPEYLATQVELFRAYPDAVAAFTNHVNFLSRDTIQWNDTGMLDSTRDTQLLMPRLFVEKYLSATGMFASMSFCSVSKQVLERIGPSPFQANGAEDSYLFHLAVLFGPVAYSSRALVAYRIANASMSANRLATLAARVHAFELLEPDYKRLADSKLWTAFSTSFASNRRIYSKHLMGARKISKARGQLWRSLADSRAILSMAKSASLLLATYFPLNLQPSWPTEYRRGT